MRIGAAITVTLLLVAGLALFSWNRGAVDPGSSLPAAGASQSADKAEAAGSFPPAETDNRPPLASDATPVELCGYGPILVRPGDDPYPKSTLAAARKLLEQVVRDMSDSPDPRDRAAAAYYSAITRRALDYQSLPTRNPACFNDPACRQRFLAESQQVLAAAADEQASSVATIRDGPAYATTWYLCQRVHGTDAMTGACTHVTAARWGELEPENAMPWIIEAGRAQRAGDSVSYEAAMSRAAAATSSNLHWFEIYRMASHPLLQKGDQATRLVALSDLVGMSAALPFPGLQHVMARCRAPALTDDHKRQCLSIASAMSRGSTHLEASMGAGIGKAVGWSDADVAAIRDRSSAIYAANHTRNPPMDMYSCNFLNTMNDVLPELAQLGEIGAGELAIKRSGKTQKELLEDFRTGSKWATFPSK